MYLGMYGSMYVYMHLSNENKDLRSHSELDRVTVKCVALAKTCFSLKKQLMKNMEFSL